jgi:hypothetical protein
LFVSERAFTETEGQDERAALLAKLPNHALVRDDVEFLFEAYDAAHRAPQRGFDPIAA